MSAIDPFTDQKELASRLRGIGVSTGYASDLATAKRQPSLDLAAKIERELGIPIAAWVGRKDTRSKEPPHNGAAA